MKLGHININKNWRSNGKIGIAELSIVVLTRQEKQVRQQQDERYLICVDKSGVFLLVCLCYDITENK